MKVFPILKQSNNKLISPIFFCSLLQIDQPTLPRKNPLLAKGHPHRPAERGSLPRWSSENLRRALSWLCVSVYVCVCVCKQRNAKSGKTLHQLEREDRALCIRDCLSVFACLSFLGTFCPWIEWKDSATAFLAILPACQCELQPQQPRKRGERNIFDQRNKFSFILREHGRWRCCVFLGNLARSLLVGTASTSEKERELESQIRHWSAPGRDQRSEERREEEISPCLLCGSELQRTLPVPSAVRGGGKVGKNAVP